MKPKIPHDIRSHKARPRTVTTTCLPVVEFWSDQMPASAVVESLRRVRPAHFVRPTDNRGWLCRFTLGRPSAAKLGAQPRILKWCLSHKNVIKTARAAGIDVVASVEVYARHYLFSMPIDPNTVVQLRKLRVRLDIVYHATA